MWRIFLKVIVGAVSVYAVSSSSIAQSRLDELSNPNAWVSFGPGSGLARGPVYDIVESNGKVWAGHRDGLYSFDGYNWTRVESLPKDITRVEPGKSHPLIVTCEGRLFVGDGAASFHELHPGGSELPVIRATETAPGAYLLVSTANVLYKWHPPARPQRIRKVDFISGQAGFVQTHKSIWWSERFAIVRNPEGLDASPQRFLEDQRRDQKTGNLIIDLVQESGHGESVIFVAHPPALAGVWEWNGKGPLHRRIEEGSSTVAAGDFDPLTKELVVVYNSGDVRIRRNQNWTRLAWVPDPLRGARMLHFSRNGDLWAAGVDSLSLFRANTRWNHQKLPFPNTRNNVHELLAARDGSLWIASQGGVEIHRSDGGVSAVRSIQGTDLDIVTGLNQDTDGNIWISSGATFGGAWRWNGSSWSHFGKAQGLTDQRIHRIVRDRTGILWFCSTGAASGDLPNLAGAFQWDGREFQRWSDESGLLGNQIYSVDRDSTGDLWFFSYHAVSRLHQGQWRHWPKPVVGTNWQIQTGVAPQPDQVYWVDRLHGLYHLDSSGKAESIPTPGLQLLRGIRAASDDTLWITSDQGVGVLRNGVFAKLPQESGLPAARSWPIEVWNGRPCIGFLGMGWACLEKLDASQPHRIQIGASEERDRTLQVSWTTASYWGEIPSDQIETRYSLDGGPWSEWSTSRSAAFRSLWPGIHHIHLQAKGLFAGIAGDVSGEVRFRGPYYLRPEYFTPIVILFASVLFLGVALVRRQQQYSTQLQARESRFRALIEKSSEGVFLLDANARMIYCSPTVERLLGRSESSLIGSENWDLYLPEEVEQVRANIRHMVQDIGVTRQFRRRIRHETLGLRWFELLVTNHLHEPEVRALVVLFRDITEQMAQAESVQRAKEQAEAASRAKSDFLATMSHEIRTPMNGVLGMAELLAATPLDDEQEDYVRTLRASGETLLSLVNDVLDLSRVESGMLVLENAPFDPQALIQEIGALWKPSAQLKGLRFDLDTSNCSGVKLLGDAGRLRQVFSNLVGNAVKFTTTGHVALTGKVWPLDDGQRCFEVEVADSGIGIAAEKLDQVFEKFVQADSSTTRQFGGTGLGLAICKQLVQLMGGTIRAESVAGRGSVFTVRVQFECLVGPLPELVRDPSGPRVEPGLRILLAEDNAVNQKVVLALLQKMGCVVEVAGNGRLAVEMAASTSYDLILMDCQMPELDGIAATIEIRNLEAALTAAQRTPIVAITANAMLNDRELCLTAGMDGFLAKPIDFAGLQKALISFARRPPSAIVQ